MLEQLEEHLLLKAYDVLQTPAYEIPWNIDMHADHVDTDGLACEAFHEVDYRRHSGCQPTPFKLALCTGSGRKLPSTLTLCGLAEC